jgi:hypothetical protein
MVVAVLGRRVGTIVVVMLLSFLFAVIFGAILRADGDRDHGGEGKGRHGQDKRFPRVLMHGQILY